MPPSARARTAAVAKESANGHDGGDTERFAAELVDGVGAAAEEESV